MDVGADGATAVPGVVVVEGEAGLGEIELVRVGGAGRDHRPGADAADDIHLATVVLE